MEASSAIRTSRNLHRNTCWRKHKLLGDGKMPWKIFVEDLAVVTTYTSVSVSMSRNFFEIGFYLIAVHLFRVFEAGTSQGIKLSAFF